MFSLIKQIFIELLSFNSFLARVAKVQTKYVSLNAELCIIRSTFTNLNPFQLKYYSFMINLGKYGGSCNVLSGKIGVPKKSEDINVKAFDMIANKNEASNQKWNNKRCHMSVKIIEHVKKIIDEVLAHVFVKLLIPQ